VYKGFDANNRGKESERNELVDLKLTRRTAFLTIGAVGISPRAIGADISGWSGTTAELRSLTIPPNLNIMMTSGYYTPGDGGGAVLRRVSEYSSTFDTFQAADKSWWQLVGPIYFVEMFGAKGDGITDDSSAINQAIQASHARGGGVVYFDGARQYNLGKTSIQLRENVSLEGQGCSLLLGGREYFFRSVAEETAVLLAATAVTANPHPGAYEISVASVENFAIGDRVAIKLGDNASDNSETPKVSFAANIVSISAGTLTLDRAVDCIVDALGAKNPENKSIRKYSHYLHNVHIKEFNLECAANDSVEGGAFITWARDLEFAHITGNKLGGQDMGCGLIGLLQNCTNIVVRSPVLYRNVNTTARPSLGRAFNFARCDDVVVYDAAAYDLQSSFCFIENGCKRVRFINPVLRSNNNQRGVTVFAALADSELYIENAEVSYANPYNLVGTGSTNATIRFRDLRLFGAYPGTMPHYPDITGRIQYTDGSDFFEVDLDANDVLEREISLLPNTHTYLQTRYGLLLEYEITAPVSLNVSEITAFRLGTVSNNGADILAVIRPGFRCICVPAAGGLFGSAGNLYGNFDRATSPVQFFIQTTVHSSGRLSIRYRVAKYIRQSNPNYDTSISRIPDADLSHN
jgi:hypothetical protein